MKHIKVSKKEELEPKLISQTLAVNIEIYQGEKTKKYNSDKNLLVKPLSILKKEDSIAIMYTRKLALELAEGNLISKY